MNINPRDVIKSEIILTEVEEAQVQQVGIDMVVRSVFLIEEDNGDKVPLIPRNGVIEVLLSKRTAYEIVLDRVKMPEDRWGYIIGRSSFNRKGILVRSSVIDPGYEGDIGVTAYCFANKPIKIGDRIAQLLVFPADAAKSYMGQHQGEKRRQSEQNEQIERKELATEMADNDAFQENLKSVCEHFRERGIGAISYAMKDPKLGVLAWYRSQGERKKVLRAEALDVAREVLEEMLFNVKEELKGGSV